MITLFKFSQPLFEYGQMSEPDLFRLIFTLLVKESGYDNKISAFTDMQIKNWLRPNRNCLPQKIARNIYEHLSKNAFIHELEFCEKGTLEGVAEKCKIFAPSTTAENLPEKMYEWYVEVVGKHAGLPSNNEATKLRQRKQLDELRDSYGAYLLTEVSRHCPYPGCGKDLEKIGNGTTQESYEVTLIDPSKDSSVDNLIACCPDCWSKHSLNPTRAQIKELQVIKRLLEAKRIAFSNMDDIRLGKGVVSVINSIDKISSEEDPPDIEYDPKRVEEKINPQDYPVLYAAVRQYVDYNFKKLKVILQRANKVGEIDYPEIETKMRLLFLSCAKNRKSKNQIFNDLTEKLSRASHQDYIHCQIVVSYFIQSCEVFNADSE